MILTVTPNPCVDKTVFIDQLEPGAKIRSQKCTCIPGGKGNNVSRAVKALGYGTAAFVVVGGPTGQHVVDMIEQQDGVRCVPIWVRGLTRTITTVLEQPIHRQTAFFEPGPEVTPSERAQLVETFRKVVPEARVVTFNGTVCHPAIVDLYRELIPIAKNAGVITILDTYGPEFNIALEAVPFMVKPNLKEAEIFAGFPLDTLAAQCRVLDLLHEKGVELVVLSLGENGALVSHENERYRLIPPAIKEINPVGSGDALVAGFAIGLQEDWPLLDAALLGVAAGTANAMSWHIGHFTGGEVEGLVAQVQVETV